MISVLLELGIPQGQVVSRWRGGEDIVKEAMERARSSAFTGYLKVSLSTEGDHSEGLISFVGGAPVLCLYVFQPLGMEEVWFLGEKAGEYLWADSLQSEAVVSLHGEVSMKDFEQLFPQARVKKIVAPQRVLIRELLRDEKIRSAETENSGGHMMKGLDPGASVADRRKVDQQAQGVYDLILQYHKMQTEGNKASVCKKCGGPTDLLGYCPECAAKEEPARAITPRMDPLNTFDTFVAGANTRFAEAAAKAVASDPGKQYNPLFIHGSSGLGKTHLLQAIGNRVKKGRRKLRVVYVPLESLDDKAVEALTSRSSELRQDMEQADLLLVDDAQFLANKDRLQEEIFLVIGQLIASGKQVVLTSDRAPREITPLSERLVTRLESGLVVDLGRPDLATRVSILRKEVSEEGLNIPEDVIAFVAERCPDNIRQLEGGMNRVMAFASLMRSNVTLEVAREVLGHDKTFNQGKSVELAERRSYLVEENRPDHAYSMLVRKLDGGSKGLVFTRTNPASVRAKLGNRPTEIYWLTEHESKGERTIPPSLEKIVLLIEEHINKGGRSIVLLDDLHYLISNATFEGVIRFIRSLIDLVSEHDTVFVVSVSPDSLKVQERSVLERELEPIKP